MINDLTICSNCGKPHRLTDEDAGKDREILRLCVKCHRGSKLWHVRRYTVEHFQVIAETRKEALTNCLDPYEVEVTKETAQVFDENDGVPIEYVKEIQ